MPITIDLTDHALYKKGAQEKARAAIINMLKDNIPIDKIAQYLQVSIDYVIHIQNELDKK